MMIIKLVIAVDVNIHLERTSDPDTVTFSEVLAGYGLAQWVPTVAGFWTSSAPVATFLSLWLM